MCANGFPMPPHIANLAPSGKAPTTLEDALRVRAAAALRVLEHDVLCARELEGPREIRDQLPAERRVDAAPPVEHRGNAVIVALHHPGPRVVEALPVLARLLDDERRVREAQEKPVDRLDVVLGLVPP